MRRRCWLQSPAAFAFKSLGSTGSVGRLLARAAEPFPTLIRALDAIHLATAELARRSIEDMLFATHDRELGKAASSLGFRVLGL